MANSSAELVWQCIKGNNCFLRKGSNGRMDPIFSAEKGNLKNSHSYKYSGIANRQVVDVSAAAGDKLRIELSKSKMNKTAKPSVVNAISGKKVLKVVKAECAKFRPDLQNAAVRRAASIQKSLRKGKAMRKEKAAGALTVV